jgi:hypothetical protein
LHILQALSPFVDPAAEDHLHTRLLAPYPEAKSS